MATAFTPVSDCIVNPILCYYANSTSQIQMVSVVQASQWLFERVVFPGQRFLFEAVPDALLEVRSPSALYGRLTRQIPCKELQVKEGGNPSSM